MTAPLVLSLFPGLGLLDMAFEEEGFCVVQARDRLTGGDHRTFHPPAGKFAGVIGGPPCKRWSRLAHIVVQNGYELAPDLIPEYCRIVAEAQPDWFLMENVEAAPLPVVEGYVTRSRLIRDVWVGGETFRKRRFTLGNRGSAGAFGIEEVALHTQEPEHSVMASGGGRPVPVALVSGGRSKKSALKNYGYSNTDNLATGLRQAGLPADFFDAIEKDVRHKPWTVAGKQSLVGNGVPLPMGRAVARAVRRAMHPDWMDRAPSVLEKAQQAWGSSVGDPVAYLDRLHAGEEG